MATRYGMLFRLITTWALIVCSQLALADPPGRVGRLADLQGGVSFYDAESADWVAAARNLPLTTGDRVSTDASGRAELRVGSAMIRLGAGTEVEVLQLDDERVRVQVHSGQLALRLRSNESAREFELVTAEARFQPERAGRFRLDRADATSRITVWSGQLAFEAPDAALTLLAGQRADLWANGGRTEYTLVAPQLDPFADEVAALELGDERSVATRYVSPEMTGVEELDRHGRWDNDAEYGALWVPRAVVPGWAPYRFGHWAWVRPWGWTWVDDAPWGFAPFHYGRWVFVRNTWCWSPGRWVARPVYAPALVAWVGSPGTSVSVGVGSTVGWFPLGPREVFVPGYRTSPHYVRNVNVTQVTNITNVTNIINSPNTVVQQTNYVNRGVPGAVTVVASSVVSGRQPVAPVRVELTDPRPRAGGPTMHTMALPVVTAVAPVAAPPARPAPPPGVGRPAPVSAGAVGNGNPGPVPPSMPPATGATGGGPGRTPGQAVGTMPDRSVNPPSGSSPPTFGNAKPTLPSPGMAPPPAAARPQPPTALPAQGAAVSTQPAQLPPAAVPQPGGRPPPVRPVPPPPVVAPTHGVAPTPPPTPPRPPVPPVAAGPVAGPPPPAVAAPAPAPVAAPPKAEPKPAPREHKEPPREPGKAER